MSVLNRLTIKNLRLNKKRTIVTIIGIILSTALMVGIGLLFSSFQDLMIRDTIGYNGKYEAKYNDVDLAANVEPMEEVADKLNKEIKKRHVKILTSMKNLLVLVKLNLVMNISLICILLVLIRNILMNLN